MKYQIGSALVSGKERIILSAQGQQIDASTVLSDHRLIEALALPIEKPASLLQMLQHWPYWRATLPLLVEYWFSAPEQIMQQSLLTTDEIHWLPPLMYPHKLICLGANYNDHNAEMENVQPPRFPYCFLKPPTTTLVGSGATVHLPGYAKKIDWEVELAVIIGQKARHVQGEAAMACIAGYSIVNDISARDWVPREEHSYFGLDWVMSKNFDGAAPMGPFITPVEFVENPQALTLTLTVNGQEKQHGNTADMVFSIQKIIEHLSTIMTLEPGDVIATGTPSGVGYGRRPQEFLQVGDRLVAEIEGLGKLETEIK
ncbi:MAG TPA: fumarylacetoacetate hydrolase family protein [Ktedonobacteraceae bacterium]|nr:fumarylacetoacetate hydrolase family protein [Ktedonobacteraceae bacterium]